MNEKAPKVLHIITRMDAGGSASNTLVSVLRIGEYGFAASLAYGRTDNPDADVRQSLEAGVVPLHYIARLVRNPSVFRDAYALLEIGRIIRSGKYDLVHTHTSKAGMLGRIAARLCGVPVVHTPHGHVFYGYFSRRMTAVYVAFERWAARFTDRIVSLTDRETEDALALGIGVRNRYATIPSGIQLRRFARPAEPAPAGFRDRIGVPKDAFLFVSIGRLVPVKGFDLLLEAFVAFDDGPSAQARLAIVGDGPERGALEALADRLGQKARVIFTGWMPDVREALWAADAFVLAGRNEGMGRAFVEAMAAGVPVIGTDVGGVATVIRHETNGLLVPAGDRDALVAAMRRMKEDSAWRSKAARNAPASVFPYYDEDTMMKNLADLYREVLGGRRK